MAIIDKLSAIGDAIREKTQTTGTMKLDEMPAKIRSIETGGGGGVPDEILNPTSGKELYKGNVWNWVLEKYGSQINFNNLDTAEAMFEYNNFKDLSHLKTIDLGASAYRMFAGSSIEVLPKIKSTDKLTDLWGMFNGAEIKEIPNGYFSDLVVDNINNPSGYSYVFSGCYYLKHIYSYPPLKAETYPYNYWSYYDSLFNSCYSLSELQELIFPTNTGKFQNTFYNCYHLKQLTFHKSHIGKVKVDIDLSKSIGYGWNDTVFKEQKFDRVTDKASYDKLKNTPDWQSSMFEYSRYNKLSAIETLESLPRMGVDGSTIKFKGDAGSLTDGGAIKDMPKEVIAAAADKGWTVALV